MLVGRFDLLKDCQRSSIPGLDFVKCTLSFPTLSTSHFVNSIPTLSIPIWSTSHGVNSHFVNSHLDNVDKVGIDKVEIDEVGS